jgi:hypothetical protein
MRRGKPVKEWSHLELLVILAGLIVGELLWVVVFTWIAVWLRTL